MPSSKSPFQAPAKQPVRRAAPRKAAAPAVAADKPVVIAVAPPAPAAKAEKPAQLQPKAQRKQTVKAAPKHAKVAKPPKLRKKPVRDSFTMPEADFALIATLKARAMAAKRETKKSELLRAGLHVLAALDTGTLVAALQALEPVKVGRPKNSGH